jgi:hypothetical protein
VFRIIYQKELLENIRNYRFLLALIICLVVIPLGFTVSQKDYADRRHVYDDTVRDDAELRKTVQDFLMNGGLAFRPPAALGLLSSGVEMVLPNAVEARAFGSEARVQFNNSRRLDNPFTSLFGRLDLAFIVTTAWSGKKSGRLWPRSWPTPCRGRSSSPPRWPPEGPFSQRPSWLGCWRASCSRRPWVSTPSGRPGPGRRSGSASPPRSSSS